MNQIVKEKINNENLLIQRKKELELLEQQERDEKLTEIFKNLIRKN